MKKFALLAASALMAVAATAQNVAPEGAVDLTKDMFFTWDGFDANANIVTSQCYWDAVELGAEGFQTAHYGSNNVTNTDYANLSEYSKLVIDGTPGFVVRVMYNRQANNDYQQVYAELSADGLYEFNIADVVAKDGYCHLNCIKGNWGQTGIINHLWLLPSRGTSSCSFDLTVTNQGAAAGEVESLLYQFVVELGAGFEINNKVTPVLSTPNYGDIEGEISKYDGSNAAISFYRKQFYTVAGDYKLTIPAGTFTVEGVSNAAFEATWTVAPAPAKTPWAIESVVMMWMGEEIAAGSDVDCLSYMYSIPTDKTIAAGDGRIEFCDAEGKGIGVGSLNAEAKTITFHNFGETGYTTPGTYTLNIPAGAIVDAEGNPNAEYTATWTVKEQPAKTPWAISEVVMQWMGNEIAAGEEVWTLSYNYVVKGEKTAMSFGEGHVEFLDANGNGVQVASDINYGYLKFPFGETGYNVAGTYTLNIPAGALVDAEGNPCEAFTATWTVKEQVELGDCFGWYFNVAEDPFMGSISLGDLEACGLFVNFPEQKNVTPDMTAEVVYSVLPYAPEDIMPLADDLDDVDPGMGVEYPVFTATGDALFTGELKVCLVDAIQYIEDHGAGTYVIQVGSVKVFDGNMVAVYSWTPNEEEGELVATIVNVTENEPAEDPTAIQAIAAEKAAKMFNLQGQRVNAAKGMVVVNGKVNFVK